MILTREINRFLNVGGVGCGVVKFLARLPAMLGPEFGF
jgi:hypothetical protein